MDYQFPRIERLADVLPAIEGRDEFILAQREWGTVVNYLVSMADTFPAVNTVRMANGIEQMEGKDSGPIFMTQEDYLAAIRRECRGLIFCPKTGKFVRRPLVKFFNVGEREETQLHRLDFSKSHSVYTKEDGSMIVPFEVEHGSGQIRWGTKMGLTEVALKAEVFVAKNLKYQEFAKQCISRDISPIFEYVAPDNHIVLKYEQESMILLAARHMITGEYINLEPSA